MEIAVAYFRAGYTPKDYPTENVSPLYMFQCTVLPYVLLPNILIKKRNTTELGGSIMFEFNSLHVSFL